jgi:outer membrane immunogenic protein
LPWITCGFLATLQFFLLIPLELAELKPQNSGYRGHVRSTEGWAMSRLFALICVVLGISGAALAADLPPAPAPARAPVVYVPPPAPVFSWTGFYIGGNAGAAWTRSNVSDSLGNSWSNTQQAVFTGGGQIGANYQVNWFVVGVEADFDWMANNHNSSNAVPVPGGDSFQLSANNRWITTLAARAGVAADNWLFYVKGGGGWVGVNNPTLTDVTTGASISTSNSNSNSGWLAGGGIEVGFAPNWTARLEYDFLKLSDQSFTAPVGTPFIGGDVITSTNRDVQTVTVGINYLFSWH